MFITNRKSINIFDQIDHKFNKLNEHKPMLDSKINAKFCVNFEYLRIMEDKLIDIFSTPTII